MYFEIAEALSNLQPSKAVRSKLIERSKKKGSRRIDRLRLARSDTMRASVGKPADLLPVGPSQFYALLDISIFTTITPSPRVSSLLPFF